MTKEELAKICLELDGAVEYYPFYPEFPVFKHSNNNKMFAMTFERDGLCINLKCKPIEGDMLRQSVKGILPAYHMNKEHWIMVKPNEHDVPLELLRGLIKNSYELTKNKRY